MTNIKEPLIDLIPQDCLAINEIITFAYDLAEKEKKAGWVKHQDANALRTPLSKQLFSIVSGKPEKGVSWYDFSIDSAWRSIGKIDEVSLRIFKAAELFSRIQTPNRDIAFHDAFASLVVACTTDRDIAQRVALVRQHTLESGVLDAHRSGYHEIAVNVLYDVNRQIEEKIYA